MVGPTHGLGLGFLNPISFEVGLKAHLCPTLDRNEVPGRIREASRDCKYLCIKSDNLIQATITAFEKNSSSMLELAVKRGVIPKIHY